MQRLALIQNGTVQNIVEGGPEMVSILADQYERVLVITPEALCGIGWAWDEVTGTFTAPAEPQPAPQPRHITVGAFLLRFGQKMAPILTSSDPVVKALCILVQAMTYIDLDDPRLTQQLPYLVQAKLLTMEELQAVLAAEIQPEERP